MGEVWLGLVDAVRDRLTRFERWMTGQRHATHAVAACRIASGLAVLGLLLSNVTTRSTWVGQASIWAEPARDSSAFPEIALLREASPDIVLIVYVVAILAAAALTIGWHTKAATVVTYVGFIAVVGQNPVVGVQSDNLLRLTLLWLLLTRAGERWSWDARRRDRMAHGEIDARPWDDDNVLPAWLTNALHNTGLLALAIQAIVAYTAAGFDKVSEQAWQQGNALYYTLQLPESRPFPGLADLASSSTVVLGVLTYLVLFTQLFFGPLLLSPISRRVVILSAVVVACVFAVLFAAPWSQLAVLAVTVLFVSDETWLRVEDWVLDRLDPLTTTVGDRVLEGFDTVSDYWTDGIDTMIRGVRRLTRR